MASFFGDGFDLYATPADAIANGTYWTSGTTTNVAIVAGRFAGSQAFNIANSSGNFVRSSGANDAVHHIVLGFQQNTTITGSTLGLYFQLSDGATNQCCIVFRSDGAILLTSATPAGTVLDTWTGAFSTQGVWYAFEFEVVIAASGSWAIRKNGNTSNDHALGGLNTKPGTNAYANKLTYSNNASYAHAVDDLLWRSDTSSVAWVGDVRCFTRMPAADSAVAWSRSGSGSVMQTNTGATLAGAANNTTMRLTPFTVNYTGNITNVTVTSNAGMAGNMKLAIYADTAGSPTTVLSSAGPQTTVAAGNNVFTISPSLAVTAGQRIWVAALDDTSGGSWNAINTSISLASGATAPATYATFPQSSPVMTAATGLISTLTFALSGNWGQVAEPQQDGATSYNYSSTVSQSDLYTLTAIGSTPSSIVGVTTRAYCQKSDAGTRNVAVQIQSGGTAYSGTSTALAAGTWGWITRTDLTDPATSAAWTATGVNNAAIGAVVTA